MHPITAKLGPVEDTHETRSPASSSPLYETSRGLSEAINSVAFGEWEGIPSPSENGGEDGPPLSPATDSDVEFGTPATSRYPTTPLRHKAPQGWEDANALQLDRGQDPSTVPIDLTGTSPIWQPSVVDLTRFSSPAWLDTKPLVIDLTANSPCKPKPPRQRWSPSRNKSSAQLSSLQLRQEETGPHRNEVILEITSSDSSCVPSPTNRSMTHRPCSSAHLSHVQEEPRTDAGQRIAEDDVFDSLDDAIHAIQKEGESEGYVFRRGQSKLEADGTTIKRLTLRCQNYGVSAERHNLAIHPADHRSGKTIKTNCYAHFNISRIPWSTSYRISVVDRHHNHPRVLPPGGKARKPPTQTQKDLVNKFSEDFGRRQLKTVLSKNGVDPLPEPRQLSNLINSSRKRAREAINELGGDVQSILVCLEERKRQDPRWRYVVQRDESDGRLTRLWWQSPAQAELAARYHDVLINDNTNNRNQYGMPLNIGIIIDNFGASRNIWYCFHEHEDAESYAWVLQNHLRSAPAPEVFASDEDPALKKAVREQLPTAHHIYCLQHLQGNVKKHLRPLLRDDWDRFMTEFWKVYRAVSPEIFDSLYRKLCSDFPAAKPYLDGHLYPTREHWAWAWTACQFTAGVRTNARVEAENRVNKLLGGPKITMRQLFDRLNLRTEDQSQNNQIAVRDVSQHGQNICSWAES